MKIIEIKHLLICSVLKRISITFLFLCTSFSGLFAEEIHKAVSQGDLEKVKQLIEADPSLVNATNYWKHTPLHKSNNIEITQYLIDKGADLNYLAYNGLAPLHLVRDYDIAKILIDSGADVDIYDKYKGSIGEASITGTVLQVHIGRRNEKIAELIIRSGAKLDKRDPNGNTELMLAAQIGLVKVVTCLLENGADLNAVNNNNHTALYFAAKHGYKSVADVLIAAGANQAVIKEENYDNSNQLSLTIGEGEAFLWKLKGSSYAVKTKNNLLLFPFGVRIDSSAESGLANGSINPKEIKEQEITMFLYNELNTNPERVFDIVPKIPDIDIVFGYEPPSTKNIQDVPEYRIAKPHKSFTQKEITVHTIASCIKGVGYLVEADGLKIFFAGMHIGTSDSSETERFRQEIDYLKQFGPIDIAIITTHSHYGNGSDNYNPYLYMIDELSPSEIHLMGASNYQQYLQCADVLKKRNVRVSYPESYYCSGTRYQFVKN